MKTEYKNFDDEKIKTVPLETKIMLRTLALINSIFTCCSLTIPIFLLVFGLILIIDPSNEKRLSKS